jgi:branched-subunit amino acid aminotransferase/4-amino-4-deoxychorismate lyase
MTNVFVVRKGRIYTPPLSANILPGITRKIIFGLCTGNNLKVREKQLKEDDLRSADEVFLTSSLTEVVPVIRIDGDKIGDGLVGPVTKILQSVYIRLTESFDSTQSY